MAKPKNSAPETDRLSDSAPAPVIRKLMVAEEDGRTRLLKRQVPAWVISGLFHIVLIAAFIIFDQMSPKSTAKAKTEPPTSTRIDDKPEKDPDLINPVLGLDSILEASVNVDQESEFKVDAPAVDGDTPGLPNLDKDFASNTPTLGVENNSIKLPGSAGDNHGGIAALGDGGAGGLMAPAGLGGRRSEIKDKLLTERGGNPETEAAVGRALAWLAKQQTPTGYWEFDGTHKNDRVAATGMCLLPFLAAGETHKSGKLYKNTVAKGLEWLKAQVKPNGQFNGTGDGNYMYSQAIGTIALCEAAGMTRDESVKKVARLAVDFIVQAQAADGSWGYTAGTNGDTSIIGWQIQALKSAILADIPVNKKSFEQAGIFLDSVSADSGRTYGYRTKGATHTLTAVALLSRQYTGWTPRKSELAGGIEYMWDKFPPKESEWDIYYYYYATQVFHFFDGPKWHVNWNPLMRGILLKKQITERTPGSKKGDIGSWPKDTGHIGRSCGKLGTTALACLTLEVYYRHLPLYKRDNGGVAADQ